MERSHDSQSMNDYGLFAKERERGGGCGVRNLYASKAHTMFPTIGESTQVLRVEQKKNNNNDTTVGDSDQVNSKEMGKK